MLLLALLACIPKMPDPPPDDWTWSVARSALPAATLAVHETALSHTNARLHHPGGDRDVAVDLVAYAYVLDHPDHGRTLIDPGYPRLTATDPSAYPGKAVVRSMGLEMGTPIADQLADGPPVARILTTHAHMDHIGALVDFPDADLLITRAEWDFGSGPSLLHNTQPWPWDRRTYTPLRFEGTGAYGPFDGHVDVFGDGTLIALPTPGHTPGHTSFVVNLPGQSVLITGDAAWLQAHIDGPSPKGRSASAIIETSSADNHQALVRFHAWQTRHPELVVLAGHDTNNRARLPADRVFR